jgi:hypothetical protein
MPKVNPHGSGAETEAGLENRLGTETLEQEIQTCGLTERMKTGPQQPCARTA